MHLNLVRVLGRIVAVWSVFAFAGGAAARAQTPAAPPGEAAAAPSPDAIDGDLHLLHRLAQTWLQTTRRYLMAATPAERNKLGPERLVAKVAFAKTMARMDAGRSLPLLLDRGALVTMFADVWGPDAPPPALGETSFVIDSGAARAEFVPIGYDPKHPQQTILVVADREGRASREALQGYLDQTWLPPQADYAPIVVAPLEPTDFDFDALDEVPHAEDAEQQRIGAVLAPLGAAMQKLHVDRDRMILDCGRGACAFGLRLAAKFPDRFAAVVLRWPVIDESVRLEALTGLPILLLRCPATERACVELRQRLKALADGSCYELTPRGEYPFAGEAGIAEWARQRRREPITTRVVLAPSDDRFRRNRWVAIEAADHVDATRLDEGPRLTAEVDREQNRITVETRGVKAFRLLLGPALVDVREFTLVVNGSEETIVKQPSLSFLVDQIMQRNDAGWLFTAEHRVEVP